MGAFAAHLNRGSRARSFSFRLPLCAVCPSLAPSPCRGRRLQRCDGRCPYLRSLLETIGRHRGEAERELADPEKRGGLPLPLRPQREPPRTPYLARLFVSSAPLDLSRAQPASPVSARPLIRLIYFPYLLKS